MENSDFDSELNYLKSLYNIIVLEASKLVRYSIIIEEDYYILLRQVDDCVDDVGCFNSFRGALNYFKLEFA